MKTVTFLILIIELICAQIAHAVQDVTVRVAVLPFEVFSMTEEPELGKRLSVELSRQISLSPHIITADYRLIMAVYEKGKKAVQGEERLKEIARILDANFVLFGSLTKIQQDMSLDVQLFSNFDKVQYYKTFAEGTDMDELVSSIAGKIEQEIMSKVALIPPSQLPQVEEIVSENQAKEKVLAHPGHQEPVSMSKLQGPAGEELYKVEVKQLAVSPKEEVPGISTPSSSQGPLEKEASQKSKKKMPFTLKGPVNIHSDSLIYDNKRNLVIFKGNVVARQDDIVIFSNTMEVQSDEKGRMKHITALGNVRIIQGERIAIGEKVEFLNEQQKLILTGNPRVWQGDNVINGKKIVVLLKQDRSIIEGGPEQRVSATIYPGRKKRRVQQHKDKKRLGLELQDKSRVQERENSTGDSKKDDKGKSTLQNPLKLQREHSTQKIKGEKFSQYSGEDSNNYSTKSEIYNFLEKWKNAWEKKDMKTFMDCYASDFYSGGKNRKQWQQCKMEINKKTSFIKVTLNDITIAVQDKRAMVSFIQKYESENYRDRGVKKLELVRENNQWKIRREKWTPL